MNRVRGSIPALLAEAWDALGPLHKIGCRHGEGTVSEHITIRNTGYGISINRHKRYERPASERCAVYQFFTCYSSRCAVYAGTTNANYVVCIDAGSSAVYGNLKKYCVDKAEETGGLTRVNLYPARMLAIGYGEAYNRDVSDGFPANAVSKSGNEYHLMIKPSYSHFIDMRNWQYVIRGSLRTALEPLLNYMEEYNYGMRR